MLFHCCTQVAADLSAAKQRIEEANKMADDSIMVAVKHQQERKAMADEVRQTWRVHL